MPPVTKKAKTPAADADGRPVVYPTLTAAVCRAADGTAMTADQAKALLGWQEESDQVKFGSDYLLTDETGVKVRCTNNDHNRPFNEMWARALAQDVLNKHFAPNGPNGETVIIGRHGSVLSAQHRLVGLVLAAQLWDADKAKGKWKANWPAEPTIDTFVAYGVDESEETTRTLDNVRPRTLEDVLFLSGLFGKMKGPDRRACAVAASNGVKELWARTGLKDNPYAPARTHSEAMEFVEKHPRFVKCVKHVVEENGGDAKNISRYVRLGNAAALMFLMASSKSDPAKWRKAPTPTEKMLDWSLWDAAEEFFTVLNSDPALAAVRDAVGNLASSDTGEGGTEAEKVATLILGFQLYAAGEKITPKGLALDYLPRDEYDVVRLASHPALGGIDLGRKAKGEDDADGEADVPTPDQIKARAAQVRADRGAAAGGNGKPAKVKAKVLDDQTDDEKAGTLPGDDGDDALDGEDGAADDGELDE
jgi:hypothetical protein